MSPRRSRWTLALLSLTLIAASACSASASTSNGYPASVRAGFMSSCTAGGASQARCGCALDSIEETFTVKQFTALEAISPSAQGFPGLDALLATCGD